MRERLVGTTLLELMIAVTLIGILSVIAYPAYQAYIQRAKIAQATGDIGRIALQVYGWRTNHEGELPLSLAEAGIETLIDPWDNPYVYFRDSNGGSRTDAAGRKSNADFDLYSLGKDGNTATSFAHPNSADDVIRANNGGYVGIAADY